MARWAALIRQRRAERPVCLVDGGDFCPSRRGKHQDVEDRYFFEGMKRLRYDAIGVGENDIRFGRKRLLETMKRWRLPLVSSNLVDKRGSGHLVDPLRIVTVGGRRLLFRRVGGARIGILSVVLPAYVHGVNDLAGKYYDVGNPRDSALQAVSELRKRGCDIIIALSHLGWTNSIELAREVPGIDIVVNGHRSHTGMHHELVDNTIVLDTGLNRSSFAEIEVTWNGGTPRFSVRDMARVLLKLDGDPALAELERDYQAELERLRKSGEGN